MPQRVSAWEPMVTIQTVLVEPAEESLTYSHYPELQDACHVNVNCLPSAFTTNNIGLSVSFLHIHRLVVQLNHTIMRCFQAQSSDACSSATGTFLLPSSDDLFSTLDQCKIYEYELRFTSSVCRSLPFERALLPPNKQLARQTTRNLREHHRSYCGHVSRPRSTLPCNLLGRQRPIRNYHQLVLSTLDVYHQRFWACARLFFRTLPTPQMQPFQLTWRTLYNHHLRLHHSFLHPQDHFGFAPLAARR